MKKVIILQILIALFFVFARTAYSEDKIALLNAEISSLEKQKNQLEHQKLVLVNEGDELSFKIEDLKRQSNSGLGVIGRYRLSQNLRKAQKLSADIQSLDREILNTIKQIDDKKALLIREYELQVNSLLQKVANTNNVQDKKAFLAKIREYQSSVSLLRKSEKRQLETIDIAKLEIREHDGPKEIREKADLIVDVANKTNTRISIIESRIARLKDEMRTRQKLDAFADEISFLEDRIAKGEVISKSDKETPIVATGNTEITAGDNIKTRTEITEPITKSGNPTILDASDSSIGESLQTGELSATPIMKNKSLSAELSQMPQSKLGEELENLEKQKRELKSELTILTDKANTFRKRAEQLEKPGTRSSVNPQKQDAKFKQQKTDDRAKP